MRDKTPLKKYVDLLIARKGLSIKELSDMTPYNGTYLSTLINNGKVNFKLFFHLSEHLDTSIELLTEKCNEDIK